MRVTHASVGVTDVMAARGDYLFHPLPGFTPGYDFVGTIQRLPVDGDSGFRVGQRVAGILPRMGAHAATLSVPLSLLVPVPDDLDSLIAATTPLDAVTAAFALDAVALNSGQILVQGVGGSVGAWVAQLAVARGLRVLGTVSARSRGYAEQLCTDVFDYRDAAWPSQVLDASGGGVDGAVDHVGSKVVRQVVRPGGRVIRTAFGGEPGTQRTATVAGALTSVLRRHGRPSERICSAPILVTAHRNRYRAALAHALEAVASGGATAARPQAYAITDYRQAFTAATRAIPGDKVVLTFPR